MVQKDRLLVIPVRPTRAYRARVAPPNYNSAIGVMDLFLPQQPQPKTAKATKIVHYHAVPSKTTKPKPPAEAPKKIVQSSTHKVSHSSPIQFAAPPLLEKQQTLKMPRRGWRSYIATMAVIVVVMASSYVTVDSWQTNNHVKEYVATAASQGPQHVDETMPAKDDFENYTVAPDLPRLLHIESLNVKARILPMSVDGKGNVDTPKRIADTGWYNASTKPGQSGALLIDGHVSGPTMPGVFKKLGQLKPNDNLEVERGDGERFAYRVTRVVTMKVNEVSMKELLEVDTGASQGLNLITCGGSFSSRTQEFDSRTLVFSVRE